MAIYTDSQLADRVNAVLYENLNGEISATELRDLLLDFIDSKLNQSASIGTPANGTIDADDLVDNEITVTHDLDTDFPVMFIKSSGPDGDIYSAIHFSYGPSGSNAVWVHFEEDLASGSSVEYVIVKYV